MRWTKHCLRICLLLDYTFFASISSHSIYLREYFQNGLTNRVFDSVIYCEVGWFLINRNRLNKIYCFCFTSEQLNVVFEYVSVWCNPVYNYIRNLWSLRATRVLQTLYIVAWSTSCLNWNSRSFPLFNK